MTYFFYKAINPETKAEVSDNIEADSPRAVREYVRSLGLLPIIVREASTKIKENNIVEPEKPEIKIREKKFYSCASKIKSFNLNEKIYFFSQLQIMFSAGLPITTALETLAKHAPKAKMRIVSKEVETRIRNGESFTESLKNFTHVFGEIAVGLCLTAENSGQLDDVMARIVEALKKEKKIKAKIINISIYPTLLIIFCIVMFFVSGLFILPKLIEAFNISLDNIPLKLKLVMQICEFCKEKWYYILIIAFIVLKLGILFFNLPPIKKLNDKILTILPVIRDCTKYLNLSPFFAVLALAYEGGLPISNAIEMAAYSISNTTIKKEAQEVVSLVTNGKLLSEAFYKTDFVSPTFNMLVITGENSGSLTNMFKEISEHIDTSIDDTIAKLMEIMKIVIVLIAGGAILITAALINEAINIPFLTF